MHPLVGIATGRSANGDAANRSDQIHTTLVEEANLPGRGVSNGWVPDHVLPEWEVAGGLGSGR